MQCAGADTAARMHRVPCPSLTVVGCSVDIAMVPAEAATNEAGGAGAMAAPSKRVTFSLADVNSLLDRLQV